MTSEQSSRRKILADLLPLIIKEYHESIGLISPQAIFSRVVDEYVKHEKAILKQKEILESLFGDVQNLQVIHAGNVLSFYLDRKTVLDVIERYLRMSFQSEGGATSEYRTENVSFGGHDFDSELRLPHISIYVKLPAEESQPETTDFYLGIAREMSPSELWVLSSESKTEYIRLDPVFLSENKVVFGALRRVGLHSILDKQLGGDHQVRVELSGDRFRILVSTIQKPTDGSE